MSSSASRLLLAGLVSVGSVSRPPCQSWGLRPASIYYWRAPNYRQAVLKQVFFPVIDYRGRRAEFSLPPVIVFIDFRLSSWLRRVYCVGWTEVSVGWTEARRRGREHGVHFIELMGSSCPNRQNSIPIGNMKRYDMRTFVMRQIFLPCFPSLR